MRLLQILGLSLLISNIAGAQATKRPGVELRKIALTQTAAAWKFKPTKTFPKTFGIVIDVSFGDQTATLFCLRDGSASLYTTGAFGIIGGIAHPTVRQASTNLVKLTNSFWGQAKPTKSLALPTQGHVRFYLLNYDGVRLADSSTQSLESPKDPFHPLWVATNRVITELRLITNRS